MNRCQRLVRTLSEDERKRISLSKFSALERQLYRIYSKETDDIPLDQLAERLQVHRDHISRTNTRLLRQIAKAYAPSDLRQYLTLFKRAGLHQSLMKEIRTIERTVKRLKTNEEKIAVYNSFFSVASRLPTSITVIQFRHWL